jgi:hypothetical protein
VKLELDQLTSESATLMLTLAEAFVLGHEIGHFLAGHLEDESRLVAHDRNPRLEFYAENSRHQDEFEADIYGFEVMRDYFEFEVPKSMLLGALVSTFEALSLAGAGSESASHPSAHDRIRNVADAYFSADTTELVRRSVAEGDHAAAAEALKTAH